MAVRSLLSRLGFALGRLLPLRSRVVLATAHGDRISGNLAWIRQGIRRELPGVPIVELADRPSRGPRSLARSALWTIRAGFHLATARLFVVDDYFFPMYAVRPRPGTRYVQVWHACGAFKKFGYSVLDKGFGADEAYARAVRLHANYDLCLVSAARFVPAYAEAFGQPPEKFDSTIGIPRTDLFFDQARAAAAARVARRRYAIPEGRRVVLYAPTFRGTRITQARSPIDLDLGALGRAIGDDHVVLLRDHPFVRSRRRTDDAPPGFVIDASDHPDVNELLLVADVLVTDYSSVIFEFSLLGRPIAFLAPDHEAYERERGFYFDFATAGPGPIFTTTAELAAWLRAGEFDTERVRRFAAESFDAADGQATARFVERVVAPAMRVG
ncbi:MAG TPA: CDP-glycerol glycerophosphotransferase family protein [Candidatus Binatia bacterium]|nr:CDP-glycerol glycerophosphotransferase family protein [Candidatus Binatia bacterium]